MSLIAGRASLGLVLSLAIEIAATVAKSPLGATSQRLVQFQLPLPGLKIDDPVSVNRRE
jgi:hypothetical protein